MIAPAKLKSIVLTPAIIIITPSLDLIGKGERKDGQHERGKKKRQWLIQFTPKKDCFFVVNSSSNFAILTLYYCWV